MNCRRIVAGIALASAMLPWFTGGRIEAKTSREYLKIPILFITDRQAQGSGYGPYRVVEKETVSRMDAGIAEVPVPINPQENFADWQKLDELERGKLPQKATLTKFPGDSSKDLSGAFDSALTELMNRYHKKEVFVFVHGFHNSFDVALGKAADLSRATGCPVILYSWPATGKLLGYTTDEGNNEWSQEHYNQVLEHLLKLKTEQGITFDLVAHSLGNRLFVRSAPILAGKSLFKDLFLVYPDFDAQTFVHYLSRYAPSKGPLTGVHCRLLISRRDKALAISERLVGGYTRLGQGADFSLTALTEPDLFRGIFQQHERVMELSKGEIPDSVNPELLAQMKEAFRIIDVTAADSGLIGHRIPYDFIAWMHFKESAPPGFSLEESQCQGLNRLSARFQRRSDQPMNKLLGNILLLVKNPTEKKKK